MYVDGQVNRRFEDVTTSMSKYEFTMSFSSLGNNGGVRTIQFKPYYGTTAGELSPAQSLTLYVTDDPLSVTVPAAKQGEDLTVTWTAAALQCGQKCFFMNTKIGCLTVYLIFFIRAASFPLDCSKSSSFSQASLFPLK